MIAVLNRNKFSDLRLRQLHQQRRLIYLPLFLLLHLDALDDFTEKPVLFLFSLQIRGLLVLVQNEEHLEHLICVWLSLNQIFVVDSKLSEPFANDSIHCLIS
jgi:hypothetical protein